MSALVADMVSANVSSRLLPCSQNSHFLLVFGEEESESDEHSNQTKADILIHKPHIRRAAVLLA